MSKPKTPVRTDETSRDPAKRDAGVDAFLAALHRAPKVGEGAGRLIFALDATMSRQPTWDRASQLQAEMFAEAGAVSGLSAQLVYFRGFGECRASKWVDNGAQLAKLMGKIACEGGITQIGKVLAHARKQASAAPVPALIYIGDAIEEPIDPLAQAAGELGLFGTKMFIFHEGRDATARMGFQAMAKASGGGYFQFDAGSASVLAGLLRAVARYASGGVKALEQSGAREARLLLQQMGG